MKMKKLIRKQHTKIVILHIVMETNKLKAFLGPFISPYVQIKEGFSVLISLLFLGLKHT